AHTFALESAGARDERGQQARGASPDDEVGIRAAHPVVADGKLERRGIAHVAHDSREACVEHENADREAVLIEATDDPARHGATTVPRLLSWPPGQLWIQELGRPPEASGYARVADGCPRLASWGSHRAYTLSSTVADR